MAKTLFSGKCSISAQADASGALTMTVDGRGDDIMILLATMCNQVAEQFGQNTSDVLMNLMETAPLLRALEGTKYRVDGNVIKRNRREHGQ